MKRRSYWLGIGAVLALAPSLLGKPLAARTLAAIQADGVMRVGLTGDYAPYSFRDADGNISGADVVMARKLANDLGVKLDLVPTTWRTMSDDLKSDRFDIAVGGVSVNTQRAEIGDFSVTLITDGKRPIVRCADKDRYASIASIDQPAVRVVFNPGGTNEAFAKANLAHAKLSEFPDNKTIFDEIVLNHADVMVTDGAEVDYQARNHPGALCSAAVPDAFNHFDKAFWMTRDPRLKAAVDGVLRKSLAAGDYQRALAGAP